MKMPNRIALAIAFLLTAATGASAHGGMTHIMGVLTKISESELLVRTVDGDTKVVGVDATTDYEEVDGGGDREDLIVGARVVVEGKETEGRVLASEVRFAKPAPSSDPE